MQKNMNFTVIFDLNIKISYSYFAEKIKEPSRGMVSNLITIMDFQSVANDI